MVQICKILTFHLTNYKTTVFFSHFRQIHNRLRICQGEIQNTQQMKAEAMGKQAENCSLQHSTCKLRGNTPHLPGRPTASRAYASLTHVPTGGENGSLPHRPRQINFKTNKHILLTPTTASCFPHSCSCTTKCRGPGSPCTSPKVPSQSSEPRACGLRPQF